MALADLLAWYHGADFGTLTNESVLAVGAAVVPVLAAQARRLKLELSNCGATTIFVGRTNAVAANSGYEIPAGGNYVIDYRADLREAGMPLWAIGSAAGGALYIREVLVRD